MLRPKLSHYLGLSFSPSKALQPYIRRNVEPDLRPSLAWRRLVVAACSLCMAAVCVAQSGSSASSPTQTTRSTQAKKKSIRRTRASARAKKRGQQKIDEARTQAIQEALIREHYLTGDPSGKWDDPTQRACVKYQADHGWQTKVVPDSRALINLGLGPDHDHLLNPQTAMTSQPDKPHTAPAADSASPAQQSEPH